MSRHPPRLVSRLGGVAGFSIDRVARAAGANSEVLRLENLDTDIPPPQSAIAATRAAVGRDDANSYLPFLGLDELRTAAARHVARLSGVPHDPDTQTIVTAGGTEGMLNALLALVETGDEVLVTDPTYAGGWGSTGPRRPSGCWGGAGSRPRP